MITITFRSIYNGKLQGWSSWELSKRAYDKDPVKELETDLMKVLGTKVKVVAMRRANP